MGDTKKTYEGMFLLDSNSDFNTACEPVRAMLDRSEAEVLAMNPWDERRLAYEIKGRKRGLYVLTYFRAQPERITELENDCQLDERILRMLVLRRDGLTDEEINAETPAMSSRRRSSEIEAASQKAADEKAAQAAADEKAAGEKTDDAPPEEAAEAPAPSPEEAAEAPAPAPVEAVEAPEDNQGREKAQAESE